MIFRSKRRPACKQCGLLLVDTTVPEMAAAQPHVRLRVFDFPVSRCPDAHEMRQRPTQESLALLHTIQDGVPTAAGGRCPVCRGRDGERLESHEWQLEVEASTGERFRVVVAVPAWRCGQCGEVAADVTGPVDGEFGEVLLDAFTSAGVRP